MSENESLLLSSLHDALPHAVHVQLLDRIAPPQDDLRQAFKLPADHHPSALGAEMYGSAVAEVLTSEGLLKPQALRVKQH